MQPLIEIFLPDAGTFYDPESEAKEILRQLSVFDKGIVLFPSNPLANDLASFLSGKLGCRPLLDASDLFFDKERGWCARRAANDSDAIITFRLPENRWQVVSLKRDLQKIYRENQSVYIGLRIGGLSHGGRLKLKQTREADGVTADSRIETADKLVAWGNGIKSETACAQLKKLADHLQAAICVSRPVVDSGRAPKELQVGLSGKTVAPSLYLAAGISGASQHTIGMNKSRTIVAINIDRNAPIFKIADLGIVGDAETILAEMAKKMNSTD